MAFSHGHPLWTILLYVLGFSSDKNIILKITDRGWFVKNAFLKRKGNFFGKALHNKVSLCYNESNSEKITKRKGGSIFAMKVLRADRNLLLIVLVLLFMGLGSAGTVALANYTNVLIEASVVNVRLGPGLSYDIMTQVEGGSEVNVLAERNEWYKVRLADGRIGWIASWLINNTEVSASKDLVATILDSSVNVREENSMDSEIVGSAVAGEKFNLLYEENGWSQIDYNGRVAWILSELIEISPGTVGQSPEAVVSEETIAGLPAESLTVLYDSVNIRNAPSEAGAVLGMASRGDVFAYTGEENGFYAITTAEGQAGYIANWLAAVEGEQESQKATASSATTLAEATIVLDAGHGGMDPGAEGSTFYEKEVTLATAEAIADRLRQAGTNVILTRTTDEDVSLEERAWISNTNQADVFISLHYDSTPEGVVGSGVSTYYYADQDLPLAGLVNDHLAANLPLPNNGTSFGNFHVLRENYQPALLLELGYINNENDAWAFNNEQYRELIAESIFNALSEYFQ